MRKVIFFILALFTGIFYFNESALAALPTFSKTIYFGDSLTDMGNFTTDIPLICDRLNAPITNHIGGTNADDVWSNILSAGFVASPSSSGGNDWAVSGSETSDIGNQIDSYLQTTGNVADPSALYVIWAGSNDIIFRIFNPDLTQDTDPSIVIREGMQNIHKAITELTQAGARNFLVMGVPDISQTPIASTQNSKPLYLVGVLSGHKDEIKQACDTWNQYLFSTLGNSPLVSNTEGVHIYTWNPAPLLADAVKNPSKYKFATTINGLPNNSQISCATHDNPDQYLFFNCIHPTTRSHTLLAKNVRQCAVDFQECSAASSATENVCASNESCLANF